VRHKTPPYTKLKPPTSTSNTRRHITTSLVQAWDDCEARFRDLHAFWPRIPPDARLGALRRRRRLPQEEEIPGDTQQPDDTYNPAEDDEALPLPQVFGVPPSKIKEMSSLGKYTGVCGMCTVCRKAPQTGTRRPDCLTSKAVRAWHDELGSVSPAAAVKAAKEIFDRSAKLHQARGKSFEAHSATCGSCLTCQAGRVVSHRATGTIMIKKVCRTVKAMLCDSLPPRLRFAVSLVTPYGRLVNATTRLLDGDPQDGYQRVHDVAEGRNGREEHRFEDEDGPSDSDNDSKHQRELDEYELEDEACHEDERWHAWGAYLLQTGHKNHASTEGYNALQPEQDAETLAVSRRGGSKRARGTVGDSWVCTAKVDSAVSEPCGHVNGPECVRCTACKVPRWDGPNGELVTRIKAALQSGAAFPMHHVSLSVDSDAREAIPHSVLEELSATIAARIALESGPRGPSMLGFDPESGAHDLSVQVSQQLPAVLQSMTHSSRSRSSLDAGCWGATEASAEALLDQLEPSGRRSRKRGLTDAARQHDLKRNNAKKARRTALAEAVITLEGATMRLVEEHAGKLAVGASSLEELTTASAFASGVAGQTTGGRVKRWQNAKPPARLQGLAAAANSRATGAGPSSDALAAVRFHNGGTNDALVSYSKFCDEIRASLGKATPSSVCELLYHSGGACPNGWTDSTLPDLIELLRDPSFSASRLHQAAVRGGPLAFSAALHAALKESRHAMGRRAMRAQRDCNDADGVQLPGIFPPPTQQSQPETSQPSQETHGLGGGGMQSQEQGEERPPDTPQRGNAPDEESKGLPLEFHMDDYEPLLPTSGDIESGIGHHDFLPSSLRHSQEEDHRVRLLNDVSTSTLQFSWKLTEAVLNSLAVQTAESLIPAVERPDKRTFAK
jgi:hypothetical protein